jgi:hypothetical protein
VCQLFITEKSVTPGKCNPAYVDLGRERVYRALHQNGVFCHSLSATLGGVHTFVSTDNVPRTTCVQGFPSLAFCPLERHKNDTQMGRVTN